MNKIIISILGGLVSSSLMAATFISEVTDSQWQNTQNSKLVCELTHSIEHYGRAVIQRQAGGRAHFQLHAFSPAPVGQKVRFSVEDPKWLAKNKPRVIKHFNLKTGAVPVSVKGRLAEQVLVSLAAGHWPVFSYANGTQQQDTVTVKLSSVNFQGPFAKYLNCVTHLLPYGYQEIKTTKVHFENNAFRPQESDYATLQKIIKYLKYDKTIKRIVLKGYSDSIGSIENNYLLSVSRANAVKDFLIEHGIQESRIETQAYGRRFPIANNQMPQGRALNRRVEIELKRV